MESGGRCTSKVRVLNVDGMKGACIVVFLSTLLTVNYKSYDKDMANELGPSTLRLANAFICVKVILDGKIRVGRQGAYMKVESHWTCEQVLRAYLQTQSHDNCPLQILLR